MKPIKVILFLATLVQLLFLSTGPASPAQAQTSKPVPSAIAASAQAEGIFTRRLALLVGANKGGPDRPVLRYAIEDARAVGQVLEDMGGVLPGDARYLEDPDKAALLGAIRALAADVDKARLSSRRVEAVFYFSGHSDEESLFLGDERVPYAELKDLITALGADVRIAILDSCASGAMTLPKGVIKRPPFLMDMAYNMKGYAFVTSSSASEAAQESGRLGRSFFTHNLISGMRGAADMNLDGRVTLNEAYQFAFDGTLVQTERTLAGAQHPSRHIQMSGTGDVVITEIRRSEAILILDADFAGRVFVHGSAGNLLVELNKAAGREVAIGLNAGGYRIFVVGESGALEAKARLEDGKSYVLGRDDFARAARVPATVRGPAAPPPARWGRAAGHFGWRIELSGGLAAINPADLNLRGTFDRMYSQHYGYDYMAYRVSQGEIVSFTRSNEGGTFRPLGRSVPFQFRVRRSLARWLDVSLGLSLITGSRSSSFADLYEVTELGGGTSSYVDSYDKYTVAVRGILPTAGVHLGGKITPSLRLELGLSGGPLFAECRYFIRYESNVPWPGVDGPMDASQNGTLEEKGKGTAAAFHLGLKADYLLTRRTGVFIEGEFAFQSVRGVYGPGTRSDTGLRDTWEGEWAMKQMVSVEPWGTGRFLWPSNGWELFGGDWWRARDFKLDLSGFQARIGVFFRF
jgi:Caspase domain